MINRQKLLFTSIKIIVLIFIHLAHASKEDYTMKKSIDSSKNKKLYQELFLGPKNKGPKNKLKYLPGLSWIGDETIYINDKKNALYINDSKVLELENLEGFSLSSENILLFSNIKKIYRRSFKSQVYIYNTSTQKLQAVGKKLNDQEGFKKIQIAQLSPNNKFVAFVFENNIYQEELSSGNIQQLTFDGNNKIFNGISDWVYEEEFAVYDCLEYSPDSKKIAFLHFDSSLVKDFTLINNTTSNYPKLTTFPYPKVGEKNSNVQLGIINLKENFQINFIPSFGDEQDFYIPEFNWINNSKLLYKHINRKQNINYFVTTNIDTMSNNVIYKEESSSWVSIESGNFKWWNNSHDKFYFLSDKDGFNNIYSYKILDNSSNIIEQETNFNYDIYSIAHINEHSLYYYASENSAIDKYLYSMNIDKIDYGKIKKLTPDNNLGNNYYSISKSGKFAIHQHSSIDQAYHAEIIELATGKIRQELLNNDDYNNWIQEKLPHTKEQFKLNLGEFEVDSYLIKPKNFNPSKKYPLVVYVYGGPATQTVRNSFNINLINQMLVENNILVACFDNRGTPAPKGRDWKRIIYKKYGIISSQDQAKALEEFLKLNPFIDSTKIGVWGHSGGGTHTLNALFHHPELYKVGVSVAGVPDLSLYDTVYQEKYMGLLPENKKVYDTVSAINFTQNLQGKLLIIHGTGDDNVHYQGMEKLINNLIMNEKLFDVMVYPNRDHGINSDPQTKMHLNKKVVDYFLTHLQ